MRMSVALWGVAVAAVAAAGVGRAAAQPLQVGDQAPAFTLPGTDGETHRLSDYAGTPVVLAWFPKAFTGG